MKMCRFNIHVRDLTRIDAQPEPAPEKTSESRIEILLRERSRLESMLNEPRSTASPSSQEWESSERYQGNRDYWSKEIDKIDAAVAKIRAQPNRRATDPHTYVSTACHHQKHDLCILECKYCQAPCQCACHTKEGKS